MKATKKKSPEWSLENHPKGELPKQLRRQGPNDEDSTFKK